MFDRLRRFVCLVCVAFAGSVLWAGPAQARAVVSVLLSETGGIYQAAADSLTRELARSAPEWRVQATTLEQFAANGSDLTVAIGTRALEKALAESSRPVLALLVPRQTYERLAAGNGRASALYLDQPLSRQLQLLSVALPNLKRAGVPLGPASRAAQATLQSAARDSGVQVSSAVINEGAELYAALTDLAENSQAFLLLPDPVVVQRGTLQNLFLHTYRLKKPVLAYSAPLVQSGALLALYSSPEQQGEEAAGWIARSWERDEFRLGAPRYPRLFTIGVNRTVARSLDIALPGEAVLTRKLEALQ